jgi:hypothetical protein
VWEAGERESGPRAETQNKSNDKDRNRLVGADTPLIARLFGARLVVTTGKHNMATTFVAHASRHRRRVTAECMVFIWKRPKSMLAGSPQSHARYSRPQHMHVVRSTTP